MHQLALARTARVLLIAAALGSCMPAPAASSLQPLFAHALFHHSPYDKAQRLREALHGREQQQRTHRDYDRVLDAYRSVYHNDPATAKADASVAAVAELLAEEGRVFDEEKPLRDAIGQYEFLRHQYPHSRVCPSALLTEAAIYQADLGDKAQAKATYQQFLKKYPHSPLSDQARLGLKALHKEELAERSTKSKTATFEEGAPSAETSPTPKHSNTARGSELPSPSSFPSSQNLPTKVGPSDAPGTTVVRPLAASTAGPFPATTQAGAVPSPRTRHGKTPLITSIRHWSTNVYTRVAIDLDEEVQYEAARVPNPDRIFFDLHGVKLSPELIGRAVEVTDDGYLKRIRAAQFSNDVTRIVLDVSDVSDYSAFLLPNPYRLIIDIHGRKPGSLPSDALAGTTSTLQPDDATHIGPTTSASAQSTMTPGNQKSIPRTGTQPAVDARVIQQSSVKAPAQVQAPTSSSRQASSQSIAPLAASTTANPTLDSSMDSSSLKKSSSLAEVAGLSQQKNRVRATSHPTSAPISASVAGTTPAPQQTETAAIPLPSFENKATKRKKSRNSAVSTDGASGMDAVASGTHEATPTSMGQRSLVRALGLKIGRIVVDAGHGGHDSGTLGPDGIEEKEIVLDVALRLGKLLKQRLGADVIYTRDDDTFIPLETRTAIANKAQADLFISVHANSSQDPSSRGVETYYLNFTSSPDALEVAARENAVSNQSIHQLSDLVKKITLKDKIDESREFAGDVQQNLFAGLEDGNRGLRDRGVKKAPFVVLIGANMPSILAEISFLTNPEDARQLRDPNYRQRIAESLYRGVSKYVGGLSGVRLAQSGTRTSGN